MSGVPRTTLLEAMEYFDKELATPENGQAGSREARTNTRPCTMNTHSVKQTIRIATGEKTLAGGDEANVYITKRGFYVAPLRDGNGEAA